MFRSRKRTLKDLLVSFNLIPGNDLYKDIFDMYLKYVGEFDDTVVEFERRSDTYYRYISKSGAPVLRWCHPEIVNGNLTWNIEYNYDPESGVENWHLVHSGGGDEI